MRAAVVALVLVLAATDASAGASRVVVDRVVVEPSVVGGFTVVRVAARAVSVDGHRITGGAWTVEVGGRAVPAVVTDTPVAVPAQVVLVVETGVAFAKAVVPFASRGSLLVGALPPGSRVALVTYGDDVDGGLRWWSPKDAIDELGHLGPTSEPVYAPALLRAVDRAIDLLDDAASGRRIVILFGDGRDADGLPEAYRRVGRRAREAKVVIHTIGYAPSGDRWPLVGLGELSKQTTGTFRWVDERIGGGGFNDTGLEGQLVNLSAELTQEVVLTALVPDDDVAGRAVSVSLTGGEADPLVAPEVRLGAVTCTDRCGLGMRCDAGTCRWRAEVARRQLRGYAGLAGLAVASIAILLVAARRRRRSRPQPAAASTTTTRPLPAPAARVDPEPALAIASPVLIVVAGPGLGRRIPLAGGVTVGRTRDADVVLDDPQVSGLHCRVERAPDGWFVVDLESSTGTFVDGARVRRARLRHRARLRVGGAELRFHLEEPA